MEWETVVYDRGLLRSFSALAPFNSLLPELWMEAEGALSAKMVSVGEIRDDIIPDGMRVVRMLGLLQEVLTAKGPFALNGEPLIQKRGQEWRILVSVFLQEEWECPACHTLNEEDDEECHHCGAPRPEENGHEIGGEGNGE